MRFVIMGMSGCGKSTVAQALGTRLGVTAFDADDFHPPENRTKMSQGIALNDADRAGWLTTLAALLTENSDPARPCVLACSALKESYRQRLRVAPDVRFVYLKGSFEVFSRRMTERKGHFMRVELLQSQFDTLEEPLPGPEVLVLEATDPTDSLVEAILLRWPRG